MSGKPKTCMKYALTADVERTTKELDEVLGDVIGIVPKDRLEAVYRNIRSAHVLLREAVDVAQEAKRDEYDRRRKEWQSAHPQVGKER